MEVGNQEQAVVQHEVSTRNRQQNTGHTTHREGDDEANSPQHRCVERDTALIHGEQPVEDFYPGRDRNDHRHDAEEGIDVGARTHGEEVVQPNDERQHRDGDGCPYQRGVTEQTFFGEGCGNF
ncbi:hypothetical protein SRABI106_04294 [Rahnella aquatilis]|nr:hypothetical protein SRABI106_04294 [Rahnella aquatilis]